MKLEDVLAKRHITDEDAHRAFAKSLIDAKQAHGAKSESYIIAVAIANAFDIALKSHSVGGVRSDMLYVWNHNVGFHTELRHDITQHCTNAISVLNIKASITKLISEVMTFLLSGARDFKPLIDEFREPPRHLILIEDGVFDVKKDVYAEEEQAQFYHFTSRLPHRRLKNSDKIHYAILNRLFDDWSESNEDKRQFLLDYGRCIIEGNNRGRALIIVGSGGNGKSAYAELCALLVHPDSRFNLNFHEAENSFALEGITANTRIVLGDELSSSYRFGGNALSRYKMLIDNRPIRINPKGKMMYDIEPNCCFIQASNTMPKFAESNNATHDRFVICTWATTNFREKKRNAELDFDLDALKKDASFAESYFNFVLDNTEYFAELFVPESLVAATESHIDASDNVKLFVEFIREQGYLDRSADLPISIMYAGFKSWLNDENPNSAKMQKNTFAERFIAELEKLGFIAEIDPTTKKRKRKRATSFGYVNFDKSFVEDLLGMTYDEYLSRNASSRRSVVLHNSDNELTFEFVEKVKQLAEANDVDLSDPKQIQALKHLMYDRHDALITSQYKEILEDY